jgi:RNA polymerase sigma-70 factor (ECF subfamily)
LAVTSGWLAAELARRACSRAELASGRRVGYGVSADLLARAHAERPAGWLDAAVFVAHARSFAATDGELAALHAGDLFLACACANGVVDAIRTLEREHFARIREFAASVDASPEFVKELTQQLRARLLVAEPDRPARIATYSGRGSLGGWVRVAAVRLARDISRGDRDAARPAEELDPVAVDPELGYLKRAYGDAVSRAVQDALAALGGDARTLLKMHYVDGLSIEQVGVAFGKSRATSARMLAAARMTLLAAIRERLVGVIGIRADEADSLLAFVRSRLDVSLARALG